MNDGGNIAISPLNSDIIFYTGNVYNAAYFFAVSHTSDGGTSWEHDTLPTGTRGWAVAFDPTDEDRAYAGGDSAYSYPALLVTTDGGATWTMSRAGLAGAVNALATVPGNGQLVFAGTTSGVFRSTNAGASWSATALTRNTRAVVVDPQHPGDVYAGTYGYGVSVSTDAGVTWNEMNAGLTCNKVLSLALRSGTEPMLFAGTEGGSVFKALPPTGVTEPVGRPPRPAAVAVFPNPCRGKARLQCPAVTGPAAAALFDHSGRLVRDFGARPAAGVDWNADLRGVPAGTYFVRVTAGGRAHIARLAVLD